MVSNMIWGIFSLVVWLCEEDQFFWRRLIILGSLMQHNTLHSKRVRFHDLVMLNR